MENWIISTERQSGTEASVAVNAIRIKSRGIARSANAHMNDKNECRRLRTIHARKTAK